MQQKQKTVAGRTRAQLVELIRRSIRDEVDHMVKLGLLMNTAAKEELLKAMLDYVDSKDEIRAERG